MTTLYNGGPVMGGTFPALIWASVISAWEEIKAERAAEAEGRQGRARTSSGSVLGDSTYTAPESSGEPEEAEAEAPEASEPAEEAPRSAGSGRTAPNRRPPNRANRPAPSSGGGVTAG